MKRRLVRIGAGATLVAAFLLIGVWLRYAALRSDAVDPGTVRVDVNDVRHLGEPADPAAAQRFNDALDRIEWSVMFTSEQPDILFVLVPLGLFILLVAGFLIHLHRTVLRPFQDLEQYAQRVARGDLDLGLVYEKDNYFGRFTWAFDSMRRQIEAARDREEEARAASKLVISTLSHDIKTPIASIRAYSEALSAGVVDDPAMQREYLDVIMRKSDEVSRLTDDLLIHALSDMDALSIETEKVAMDQALLRIAGSYRGSGSDVRIDAEHLPQVTCDVDPRRFEQVMDNLIRNAEKYGSPPIIVGLEVREGRVVVSVRDHGEGIDPEDLPFATTKFYRGANSDEVDGSGLGLFIVEHLVTRMGGAVRLLDADPGLLVEVDLPRAD